MSYSAFEIHQLTQVHLSLTPTVQYNYGHSDMFVTEMLYHNLAFSLEPLLNQGIKDFRL